MDAAAEARLEQYFEQIGGSLGNKCMVPVHWLGGTEELGRTLFGWKKRWDRRMLDGSTAGRTNEVENSAVLSAERGTHGQHALDETASLGGMR